MIDKNNNTGYTFLDKEESAMSSIIVLYSENESYIGADSRCIDSITGKIKNDDKDKIIVGNDLLVAVTGRASFPFQNKEYEIEDWLRQNPTFENVLTTAHECMFQLNSKEHTNFMVLHKRNGIIKYTDITVMQDSINIKTWKNNSIIVGGVSHCANFHLMENIKNVNDMVNAIKFDKKIDEAGGRNAVGGKIKIWKFSLKDGINQIFENY